MGRKRKPGKREPNGQLSRRIADMQQRNADAFDRQERDIIGVGLEARQRVHGVHKDNSRDQMAGCFVGRLCLQGEVSRAQYEAAMTYLEEWHDNLRAIGAATPPQPSALDPNATRGRGVGEEDVAKVRQRIARWKASVAAVQERQIELRGAGALVAAMDYCVLRDEAHPHLIGSVREALNALARHYRIVSSRAA